MKTGRLKLVILIYLAFALPTNICANNPANAKMARQLFNTAYKSVYGAQGSTLSYAVNIWWGFTRQPAP